MSETLYRKYRPQVFADLVNQNHIKITLLQAVKTGKISHAYLFTGPRGVGKTTVARIFAKAINCTSPKDGEPCNACEICKSIDKGNFLDLVELDAASRRKIEEIKDFKELIKYQPNIARYKVFIIDEVHMLTDVSFNALLKTIEEPPEYAIFILCTTAVHKIPDTIISRCQRFDFKKIPNQDIIENLNFILKKEGYSQIDQEVLETVAFLSEGGLRDAQSLLGQLVSLDQEKITAETAFLVLPKSNIINLASYFTFLHTRDLEQLVGLLAKMSDEGDDFDYFSDKLIELDRYAILYKISTQTNYLKNFLPPDTFEQIKKLIASVSLDDLKLALEILLDKKDLFKTQQKQLPLELAAIEFFLRTQDKKDEDQTSQPPKIHEPVAKPTKLANADTKPVVKIQETPIEEIPTIQLTELTTEQKQEILNRLTKSSYSLSKILAQSVMSMQAKNTIQVQVQNRLHQEQIKKANNHDKLRTVAAEVLGTAVKIETVINSDLTLPEIKETGDEVQHMLNVFGGQLVDGALEE